MSVAARGAALALVLSMVALVLSAGAVAAASAMTFYLTVGGSCVTVYGSEPNSTVVLTWKDAQGNLKPSEVQATTDWGYSYHCLSGGAVTTAGDRIKASDGVTVHKLVVPDLSIRINRTTETLRGTGPANAVIRLQCGSFGSPFPSFEGCMWHNRTRATDGGTWSWRFLSSDWNILGSASFYAEWLSPGGDDVWADGYAPYLVVRLANSTFAGAYRPNQTAHVVVAGATLDVKATGTATGSALDGTMRGHLLKASGKRYALQAGDQLSSDIAADAKWVVPAIDATADAATDTVSGKCWDSGVSARAVLVEVYRLGHSRGWGISSTESDGSFALWLANGDDFYVHPVDIHVGDRIVVSCFQNTGDVVEKVTLGE